MMRYAGKIIMVTLFLFVMTQGAYSASFRGVDLHLYVEAQKGNIERVREELAKGPSQKGLDYALRSVLHSRYFSRKKDVMMKIMDILIEKGANINQKNRHGHPMLFDVAGRGDPAVLEYLLRKGGKADISNGGGSQMIHKAAFHGSLRNVRVLLRHGAKIDSKSNTGSTPLHSAAIRGDFPAINIGIFLIEKGAPVNAVDTSGRTPLVMACMNGRTSFVQMLIEKGADLNIRTKKGVTALSAAKGLYRCYTRRHDRERSSNYRKLMQVLSSRGAKEGRPYRVSGGR